MPPEAVTADAVRQALRAIRIGGALKDSPLLRLHTVSAHLNSDRTADTRELRTAYLPRWLEQVTWRQLAGVRGEDPGAERGAVSPELALSQLASDFQAHSTEQEAWGILYFRYFSGSRVTMLELAEILSVSYNTVRRRVGRGYELLAGVLRDLEQAADAAVGRGHNFPQPLTRFIGRDREIADVRALLAEHRLVTLTGPGGVGKSRLAIRVATDMASDYPEGAWFVELAAVDDDHLVPSIVATTLGLRDEPRRSVNDILVDFLAERRALLVLDNCEHLVRACSDLTDYVLRRAPDIQVLATSRERLGVDSEAAWSVPPMAVPALSEPSSASRVMHCDSVRLFANRASSARPGFQLTDSNAGQIARICAEVEGIPLAVELASARTRFLSLDQLEEKLSDRFRLLTGGSKASRAQHETLRLAMDWSYELLSEQEQMLLRRVSVFRGGWTMEAAEAVCSGDGIDKRDVLELLTQLEAKSLVQVRIDPNEVRYGMLETVRQYAHDSLTNAGQSEAVLDRHLTYFDRLIQDAKPHVFQTDDSGWRDRIDTEHGNLRAAIVYGGSRPLRSETSLALANRIARYWWTRGRGRDALDILEDALANAPASCDLALRASALNNLGSLNLHLGEYAAADVSYEGSKAVFEELGDAIMVSAVQHNRATVLRLRGRISEARALFESCLRLERNIADEKSIATTLSSLGSTAEMMGDLDAAEEYYAESLAIRRSFGLAQDIAIPLVGLGRVARLRSDYTKARQFMEEALDISRSAKNEAGVALVVDNLGSLSFAEGALAEARTLHQESLALRRESADMHGIAESLGGLIVVAIASADYDTAEELLSEALDLHMALGEVLEATDDLVCAGEIGAMEGRSRRSLRLIGAATRIRDDMGAPTYRAECEDHQGIAQVAWESLGRATAELALAEGHTLTLDEAVAYALGEVTWDEMADEVAARIEAGEGEGEEAQEDASP